jgi:hypothetical protein
VAETTIITLSSVDDTTRKLLRLAELLNSYGEARLGNDWWPGNAGSWIGDDNAHELEDLYEFASTLPEGARKPTCQDASADSACSDDRLEIYRGETTPVVVCGKHAQQRGY